MPRPGKSWPANTDFSNVSRDSSVVAVDVLSPMPTPGRSDSSSLDDSTVVRGMFGKVNSDSCPTSLPDPTQCCGGSLEWKRRLEQSPISLVLLIGMRVLNAGAIASGVIAIYLGTLCAVEDLGLGGWAELFFSVGITEIGLGVFGIYATYFHIYLLFYLFAMVLLWLAAIWLALFLRGYYAVMNRSFYELALSGGLQQRFIATADPDSPEMKTLAAHSCVDMPYSHWAPACQGVLHRYVEEELHLELWHAQMYAGIVLLVVGSICSYGIVGPRTGVNVILDGARYMQGSVAFTWACLTMYWFLFLDWDWGEMMALTMCGVSIALCVVPCCVSSGSEEARMTSRRASPRERLKWWRPRFTLRCGVLTYALLALLATLTAWYCLSNQQAAGERIRGHFGRFCDEDCTAGLREDLRLECEAKLAVASEESAAAAETISEVESAEALTDPLGAPAAPLSDAAAVDSDESGGGGGRRRLVEDTDGVSADPCEASLAQVQERFVEGKMAQLDYVGWTMVFVAEVELLQCACLLYKSWALRLRRRGRAASPYREPSI